MEHTGAECLSHGEISLRQPPTLPIILMVPWEKHYLDRSEGLRKEKAYIARKIS